MGGCICKLNPVVKGSGAGEEGTLCRIRIVSGNVYLENIDGVTFDDNQSLNLTHGLKSEAQEYGNAISIWSYDTNTAEHTGLTGSYDHTGGDYERLFTCDTASFTSTDADNQNILVLSTGERAIITNYISTTEVVVHGMGWDSDFEDVTFDIYPAPSVMLGDKYHSYFNVDGNGCVCIYSFDFTSSECHESIFHISADIGADDVAAQLIDIDANGYSKIDGLAINYNTGDLQPTDISHCIHINLNESGAASADATTDIDCIYLTTTNASDSVVHGIHIGTGFNTALKVSGIPAVDPDYGYEVSTSVVTDRVNSGGTGDDAFVNASVDQTILDADSDYILIGNDDKFEIIEAIFTTVASSNCELTFYYSIGSGDYTQFYPEDNTNGFTKSGQIIWDQSDLTGWAEDDEAESDTDITEAYYIKIVRTKNNIVTAPKESYFKIYTDVDAGMTINGDGSITPTTLADTAAANSTLYYSSTQSKLVYKDSGGSVHDLW